MQILVDVLHILYYLLQSEKLFCIMQCEIDTEYPAVQKTLVIVIGELTNHWIICSTDKESR